jgi:YegS/Rv2252/BmrU family lipid kinase
MKTAVIVNPRSGGGDTGRRWAALAGKLAARLGPVETRFTERPGHGIALARELAESGFERIIAAGGDGTINEAANGLLEAGSGALGILPLGTGGDFRRTLGVPKRLDDAIEALASAKPRRIDAGKAVFQGWDGRTQTRYFINLLSFGMGGEVASRANNLLTPLGGTAAFLYATAIAFFVYRRKQVRLRLDGAREARSFVIYNVAVGNGRFHGGGMQACPTADLSDGVLEVTVIEYLRRWEAIRDFPVLYSDNVYRHPKVKHLRGARLAAESFEEVRIEVDGEPLGTLPLEVSVAPASLTVLAP